MEPALKQRLIGAAVLVALAVIFLPMLIKGPAPESGVSDVSLDMPASPGGEYETRELSLVTPGGAPRGGALGMDAPPAPGAALPTVDTTRDAASGADPGLDSPMMPPTTAGGDYAVSFGSYASAADADRVVGALRASQLPGYREEVSGSDGRTLFRVRVGPYASQAEAEAARLRAAHVRDDVGSRVVVLDAGPSGAAAAVAAADTAPAAKPEENPATPEPVAPAAPSPPVASRPAAAPAAKPAAEAAPAPAAKPATADVGFAVQLGAFSVDAEADKLRERAQAAGFNTFVERVRTDKGTLSRVRVGPVLDRAEADRLKAQVAAKLGINGFVQSHP